MAATLDRISHGRIDINIVPGGIQGDQAHRYSRAEEFIQVCRKLWASPNPVVFNGEHIQLNGAVCSPGPIGNGPKIYLEGGFGGSSRISG